MSKRRRTASKKKKKNTLMKRSMVHTHVCVVWQDKGPVVSLRGFKNTHFVKSGERELQFTIKLPLASQEIFKKGEITYFSSFSCSSAQSAIQAAPT